MKSVLALAIVAASGSLLPVALMAANDVDQTQSTSQTTTTTTTAQDSSIASKIKTEMAAEHVGSLTSISVNADPSGVVSLSGSAATQDDIDKVVSIAHNTAGVTAVNNSLTVKSN